VEATRVHERKTLALLKLWRANGGQIMAEKFMPYDPADVLDSLEAIEIYLVDAFETGDASHITAAFKDVMRAKGMETLPERAGLSLEQFRKALSDPETISLKSTLAILGAVGLNLTVAPASQDDTAGHLATDRGAAARLKSA
jgi:probable addiction module antidote protein